MGERNLGCYVGGFCINQALHDFTQSDAVGEPEVRLEPVEQSEIFEFLPMVDLGAS